MRQSGRDWSESGFRSRQTWLCRPALSLGLGKEGFKGRGTSGRERSRAEGKESPSKGAEGSPRGESPVLGTQKHPLSCFLPLAMSLLPPGLGFMVCKVGIMILPRYRMAVLFRTKEQRGKCFGKGKALHWC